MLIRAARPEDAAAVGEVHTRTWQAAYEHVFGAERLAGIDPERRRAAAGRAIASGGVWVAEEGGRVVGFVSIGDARDEDAPRVASGDPALGRAAAALPPRLPATGELYAIYVLPEAWGSGAGTGLVAAARDALRERYAVSVLWVLEDNPRARRFYEREGWAPDGARKEDTLLGAPVAEVRYRLSAAAAGRT